MDDDRKVTDLIARSKKIFLKEFLDDFKQKHESYNLETEFAKTKKNHSILIPGVILSMLIIFALGALGLSFYIEQTTQQVELDFDEFDDVNLRDVLDSWLQVERRIEEKQKAIEEITEERDTLAGLIEREGERRVELLEVTEMPSGERAIRIRAAGRETELAVAGLLNTYGNELDGLKQRLENFKRRQTEEFDERQVAAALERRYLIEDQQRLFQNEMTNIHEYYLERLNALSEGYEAELASYDSHAQDMRQVLTRQYEARIAELDRRRQNELEELYFLYNPDLSETEIQLLLEAPLYGPMEPVSYSPVLQETGVASMGRFDDLRRQIDEVGLLLEKLNEIPFENSVPEVLLQIGSRFEALVDEYDSIWYGLAESYQNKAKELSETVTRYERRISQLNRNYQTEINEFRAEYEQKMEQKAVDIDSYDYALSQLIVTDRENGFVIDPRDTSRIRVFFDRIHDVEAGMEGVIFRDPEGYVANVSFYEHNNRVYARAERVDQNRKIRPFDRILIQLSDVDTPAREISSWKNVMPIASAAASNPEN